MPQYYLVPKKLARAFPVLGRCSQWLEAQAFRLVFGLLRLLSPQRASAFTAAVFGLTAAWSDKAEKADTNLAIAFPDKSAAWRKATVKEVFRSLGRSAAELAKLDQIWAEREQRLEFVVAEASRELVQEKKPMLFVSAHVGAWQVTTLTSINYGLQVSTVYAPESNPIVKEIMLSLRKSFGARLIGTDEGVRPLLRELMKGNSIGIAMDTRLSSGQLIPFFGRDALTNTSAARLALRTGAAVVPIRGERLGDGRYRVSIEAPITCSDAALSSDEQAIEITTGINACFERWIREQPGQWVCMKRRWPKAHKL